MYTSSLSTPTSKPPQTIIYLKNHLRNKSSTEISNPSFTSYETTIKPSSQNITKFSQDPIIRFEKPRRQGEKLTAVADFGGGGGGGPSQGRDRAERQHDQLRLHHPHAAPTSLLRPVKAK